MASHDIDVIACRWTAEAHSRASGGFRATDRPAYCGLRPSKMDNGTARCPIRSGIMARASGASRYGPGRYRAYAPTAAMVVLFLVPYLGLSGALDPLTPIIATSLHTSEQTLSIGYGGANAGYALGTVLAVQLAQHWPQRRLMVIYASSAGDRVGARGGRERAGAVHHRARDAGAVHEPAADRLDAAADPGLPGGGAPLDGGDL